MPRELGKDRPKSTIADMIDFDEIEQATDAVAVPNPASPEGQQAHSHSMPPISEPATNTPQRTGEHTDIQKMYRLTPTAHRALQKLSLILGENLGFDINNSAVLRSILRIIHDATPTIRQIADERLTVRRQPSTAIGNEHIRDDLESEIAAIILDGIRTCAESNPEN